LPPQVVREHHGRLARVLEATPGADPEAVAVHLLGAGEAERGARFAERAAKQASKQLALDQAARLYRLTIENLPPTSPKVPRMRRRLAEVLGWAGRSEEAGRAYLAAAGEAPRGERFELERSASEQLLAAGRIDEGAQVLRRLLANAGVKTPLSPLTAVFWLVVYKVRLKLLGLKFVERSAEQVRPEDHARLGAMNVGALGLASVDTVLAACMQARQMVEALRAGDRSEVLRAAIIYAIHLATRGGVPDKHERVLHQVIDRLVEARASAEELAYTRGTGGVGIFLRGKWREALETIDKAYAKLPNHVAGWQTQASLYAVYALVFLGDLVEARRRHARCLADAEQRGDLFTSVQLRASHPTVLLLAADDPESARRQTREARQQWTHTKFLTQHWQFMRSDAEIELYAGNGAKAYERLQEDEASLRKSFLLNVQFMRALTFYVRGRAAIASMDGNAAIRSARLAEARQLAGKLEREGMPWTRPLAAILTASAANADGDRAKALVSLETAARTAREADMALYAAAARYQLGRLVGGKQGAQWVEEADEILRVQEIRAPERFAAMLVPGPWVAPDAT
ncbi:MAG TPA: hypothetical protein VKU41_30975, partial [Polyangiaceae bacterium]|nr:hypothetical protein [Polyangiaceae bacterium]